MDLQIHPKSIYKTFDFLLLLYIINYIEFLFKSIYSSLDFLILSIY